MKINKYRLFPLLILLRLVSNKLLSSVSPICIRGLGPAKTLCIFLNILYTYISMIKIGTYILEIVFGELLPASGSSVCLLLV